MLAVVFYAAIRLLRNYFKFATSVNTIFYNIKQFKSRPIVHTNIVKFANSVIDKFQRKANFLLQKNGLM